MFGGLSEMFEGTVVSKLVKSVKSLLLASLMELFPKALRLPLSGEPKSLCWGAERLLFVELLRSSVVKLLMLAEVLLLA